jgi:hypothetical protein
MPFPAFLLPFAKALAVNTGKNILTGQDPLKNAGTALVTGGILGGVSGDFAGADAMGGAQPTSFMPPTMAEDGAFKAFNMATNAPTGFAVTEAARQAANPLIAGGASAGGLSIDPAASGFSRFLDGLPDYVTPENVLGAADILSQSQPRQMPMPTSSASVSRGTPRQGAIDYGMAQPIRRRGLL